MTADAVAERLRAERLRAKVAGGGPMFAGRLIPMTIGIGLAVQQEANVSIDRDTARADDALYSARRGGRNQIVKDRQPTVA